MSLKIIFVDKKKETVKHNNNPSLPAFIPQIGFGTYKLTGHAALTAVGYALEAGYRHFDTAQFYGNEEEVGQAVRNAGMDRDHVFITTKVFPTDFNRLPQATEESLRKLKTDYVDLLLLHWPSDEESNKIAFIYLNEMQAKGYTRYIGVSNFNIKLLQTATSIAPVDCNQVEYHPYISQEKMGAWAREHHLFLTAYSPLAKGCVFADQTLMQLSGKYGKTVGQLVLRWLLQQGNISDIPKASSAARIKENLDIFDFSLTTDDMEIISGLSHNSRITSPAWAPEWD
jgi:2,5-diketo-D-gluconate reductase B